MAFLTNMVFSSSDEVCKHCNCRKGRHCNSFCPSRDGKGFTQKCFAFSGKYRTSKCDKNRNPKQYGRYARTYPQRRPQGGRLSGATFPNERAHDLASTAQVDRARPAASETLGAVLNETLGCFVPIAYLGDSLLSNPKRP